MPLFLFDQKLKTHKNRLKSRNKNDAISIKSSLSKGCVEKQMGSVCSGIFPRIFNAHGGLLEIQVSKPKSAGVDSWTEYQGNVV